MNTQPKSEAELAAYKIWKKGEYAFEITEATQKTASTGKIMIEMKVRVFDGDGGEKTITERLLAETPLKLAHAAQACGIHDKYLAGEIADADFIGKTGRLFLGIEKDKQHKFPDKNVVTDYVVPPAKNGSFNLSRQA